MFCLCVCSPCCLFTFYLPAPSGRPEADHPPLSKISLLPLKSRVITASLINLVINHHLLGKQLLLSLSVLYGFGWFGVGGWVQTKQAGRLALLRVPGWAGSAGRKAYYSGDQFPPGSV